MLQETLLHHIDIAYAYELAKKMETFRSNPVLGYRGAGSRAEFETGEMLREEMERIGLSQVRKDPVTVDGWEFSKAVLSVSASDGLTRRFQLGAYQTSMVTGGPKPFSLVYVGKGGERDYEGVDVSGKLVLADINQRDEWWINYPVYEAHLHGAAALIAVQSGGYGEIDEEALNAQDIAGPANAPAFSISRRDARLLKQLLAEQGEIQVFLDADTRVIPDCTTYNITGCIPGRNPDRIVLLSAHYDSYFSGFQDDNTAVAMMLGIARAWLKTGVQPNNTIMVCAMAAEEWGVSNSNFDWSAGAYEQVNTARPEWVGKVIADLNFELPALAHGTRARIRCCYEYMSYLREFLSELPVLTKAYPEEPRAAAPIETWSDDFSMAISGIPSMVNDFTGGSFMETHYHSQFDNDDFFDPQVYRLHHELFALLIEALDKTAVIPLDFSPVLERTVSCIERGLRLAAGNAVLTQKLTSLQSLAVQAARRAQTEYEEICETNSRFRALLEQGKEDAAMHFLSRYRPTEQKLLARFKAEQDAFVRIDWYGNVLYPHEILIRRLELIEGAVRNLKNGRISQALQKLEQIDNNTYAFTFSRQVYRHFTDYVFNQPKERLKWGYGRLMPHQDLYDLIQLLNENGKTTGAEGCLDEVISRLEHMAETQYEFLAQTLDQMSHTIKTRF